MRPHPLMSSASPVKAALSSSDTKVMQPLVWPGVARTEMRWAPKAMVSSAPTSQSALALAFLLITDFMVGIRCFSTPVLVTLTLHGDREEEWEIMGIGIERYRSR